MTLSHSSFSSYSQTLTAQQKPNISRSDALQSDSQSLSLSKHSGVPILDSALLLDKGEQAQPANTDRFTVSDVGVDDLTYGALAATGNAARSTSDEAQTAEEAKADEKKIQELKDRDREVRLHEQAHAAVGGQYAGAPTYEFETGPDGKQYAVGGEVSIDVSEEETPKDTIDKMQVVRAAALAPAEPSPQDFKVASEATQKEQAARAELAQQSVSKSSGQNKQSNDTPDMLNQHAQKALQQYQTATRPLSSIFEASA